VNLFYFSSFEDRELFNELTVINPLFLSGEVSSLNFFSFFLVVNSFCFNTCEFVKGASSPAIFGKA